MSSTKSHNQGHLVVPEPSVFDPTSIPQETHDFNQKLMNIMKGAPKWYEVGAPAYREMRRKGETPLPATTYLDSAKPYSIPSRNSSRTIPCRLFRPTTDKAPVASPPQVYMHIHGGGWVLQAEDTQDPALQEISNSTGTTIFSVGYRLAPEDPFPAGIEDCYDAAMWLVTNAEHELGGPLSWVGGESAGAHLAALVALHLLQHEDKRYSEFRFRGLLLHFGAYDLSGPGPSALLFRKPEVLVLDDDLMNHYFEAAMPGWSVERRKKADVSPLYADLDKLRGRLPPALFTCGTEDCLLTDTVFMSTRWQIAGGKTTTVIVPGGAHGYIMFPRDTKGAQVEIGLQAVEEFIRTN